MCKRFTVLLAVFGLLACTGSVVYAQDDPCAAVAIDVAQGATATVSGDTTGAAIAGHGPFANAPAAWFTVVGDGTRISATTCPDGTTYDSAMSLYTGNCGNAVVNTSTSGGDIWTGGDDFQFDYTSMTGDFDVAIELVDYSHDTGLGRWGKMGLMARRELTRESEFMQTQFHGPSNDDIARQAGRREHGVAGGGMYEIVMDGAGPRPVFTRLTRRGNIFQSWWSADAPADPRDDASWTAGHAEDRATMGDTVFVGVANSDHNSDGAIPQHVSYASLNDDFNELSGFVGNDAGGGSGTAAGGLTIIADNDDVDCGAGWTGRSGITWDAEAGVTYHILVNGWNTSAGAFEMSVTMLEAGPIVIPVDTENIAPGNWIRAKGWNFLLLDQDAGCGGGGVDRMAEANWAGQYNIHDEEPQAGDVWDIDFGASQARSWTSATWRTSPPGRPPRASWPTASPPTAKTTW